MCSSRQPLESYLVEHRESLRSFIRSKVGDEELAEDILQDSLLKALHAAPDLEDEERLVPWIYRIIRNAITDTYRREAAAARRLERYALDVPHAVPPPAEAAVLCSCFHSLLPDLKPEYAEVIEAMDLGGIDTEEMARRLRISPNNLKVRHHRARQQLRRRLEETCRSCAADGCRDCTCSH